MVQSLTTDERFDKVDAQLSELNKQFDRIDEQFNKLTAVIIQGFEGIGERLEDKADKADLQRVYDYLDKIIKQQEINDDERLIMGHQLDRWVHEVADKIGYTLAT